MSLQIHSHQLTNDEQASHTTITNALRILKPHLPISIPLYRRLQFGRFFESSTLLTNLPTIERDPLLIHEPWLIAFVDRSCRPETEIWIFASWEPMTQSPDQDTDHAPDNQKSYDEKNASLLKSLIKAIKNLGPPPTSIHQDQLSSGNDNDKDAIGNSRKEYAAHMLDSNLILCGAAHESTTRLLEKYGLIRHVFDAGLVGNWTYVFDTANLPEDIEAISLPHELCWGELGRADLALVRSRTQIPRQERTLAQLPNVAIFERDGGRAAGWVFVGLDGSLTSLHVEEEWRGRKLGMLLARKVWEVGMEKFWEKREDKLAHDYVIVGNEASKKVSERLGGIYIGDTYWVRVDLGAV